MAESADDRVITPWRAEPRPDPRPDARGDSHAASHEDSHLDSCAPLPAGSEVNPRWQSAPISPWLTGAEPDFEPAQQALDARLDRLSALEEILGQDGSSESLAAMRFQARLVEAIKDAVIATDGEFRIRVFNHAAERMYGLESEAILGCELANLIETDFGPDLDESELSGLLKKSDHWAGRLRQRGANGDWMDVDATATRISDDKGDVRGAVFLARDVTPLRRAEQEAVDRTEFAAAVLESLPGRTCVVDRVGVVIETNQRYREEGPAGSGAASGPGAGADYLAWLAETVDEDAVEALRELMSGKRAEFHVEFAAVRRRKRRWTELRAVPLGTQAGGVVITHVDITTRKQAENQLTRRATHDPLTGLPNRVLLADRLSHALARTARTGGNVGVLFCDLDGFRDVNNTYGHLAGDRLLVTIAKRLRAVCRSSDTVARVSGDEFVIVLEDVTGAAEVEEVARRIIDALTEPVVLEEGTARTGTSIGLVISPGVSRAGVRTVENLIRDSDAAMYAAKEAGRGRFAWFAPEMRERPMERPTFVQAIGRLLNR